MEEKRVKFSKHGPVRFLGHLDVMRYFQKAVRRAGIPVMYTEGYSPHQIMSFAQPLSVGATSDGEYMDMRLSESMEDTEVMERFHRVMNEGFEVMGTVTLPERSPKAMTAVSACEYALTFREGYEPLTDWAGELAMFLTESDNLPAVKKTKKGEKAIDMKPLIYRWEIAGCGGRIQGFDPEATVLHVMLSAGSSDNLKPSMIMESFLRSIGAIGESEGIPAAAVMINRIDTCMDELQGQERYVIPMIETERDNPMAFGRVRITCQGLAYGHHK